MRETFFESWQQVEVLPLTSNFIKKNNDLVFFGSVLVYKEIIYLLHYAMLETIICAFAEDIKKIYECVYIVFFSLWLVQIIVAYGCSYSPIFDIAFGT